MNIFLHKAVFNWSKENWKGRSTNLMWNRIRTRGKLTSHNWAIYMRVVQISVAVFYMHRDLENTDLWLLVLTFVCRCSLLLNSAVIGKLFSGRTNEANHNYVICLAEKNTILSMIFYNNMLLWFSRNHFVNFYLQSAAFSANTFLPFIFHSSAFHRYIMYYYYCSVI